MTDADSTGNVTIPIGDSDATVEFFEYVDPIVDAYFSLRGRTSRRRFLNIVRMRYRAMCRRANLDPAWAKQFERRITMGWVRENVRRLLEPSYSIYSRNET